MSIRVGVTSNSQQEFPAQPSSASVYAAPNQYKITNALLANAARKFKT